MKRKKKLFMILCPTAILLVCIGCVITHAWCSSHPNPPVSVAPGFSSGAYTPGLYNQKQCVSDYQLPTVTHSASDFLFYHATSEYSYGITSDGYEVFSFLNSDGTALEALRGGGTFLIGDQYARAVTASTKHVKDYEQTSGNCLTVYYDTSLGEQFTQYVFHDNNVEVSVHVAFPHEISNIIAIHLDRNFINGYIDSEKKVTSDWVFPTNNDFPYRTFDSYVLTNYIDSTHKLYSFWREDAANPLVVPDYLSDCNFQVTQVPSSLSSYSLCYTLVFEDLTKDQDPDYFALFKGKDSELAIGITPKHELKSNSTLFDTKEVAFNINISNLSDSEVKYDIKYCIYDYYGNKYTDMKESRKLDSTFQANYSLTPSLTQNGIYYLDATVSYDGKEYRELYPFIVYDSHDYQYTSTSPFGLSGVRFGAYLPNNDTVYLAKEMGIANMRVCISVPDYIGTDYTLLQNYLAQLQANGTKITGQYLLCSDWTVPTDTTRYASELANVLSYVGSYLVDCEIGNEYNLKYRYTDMNSAVSKYLKEQFDPTYSVVTENFGLPIISAGVYLSLTDWLEATVKAGLWERFDILSTHAYSFPHSPDLGADPSIEHSYESALNRIRKFMDAYGEKTWYLSEFGYPTTPGSSSGMFSGSDLRSQADYTVREFILGLSYGADVLECYALYDGVNTTLGFLDNNCEYHYGMFYSADYYGRIMPKPLVMSYITMTQELDGYVSCSEVPKVSATSRVFEITLQQSDTPVYVCWSNCKRLSTDIVFSRTPGLPWQNQWTGKENITFYTNSYVEVIDSQGNSSIYYPKNGAVSIPVSGEPIYIKNATLTPSVTN
ncbi:MAG: hypothetical protein IJW37_08945 [Lachnospiraceae bacterium]|nr:hypothetical protein [Lachnospiraceae bacterium]